MPGYCIKLTNQEKKTHNACRWQVGRWNPAGVRSGNGGLCGRGFYHAYDTEDPWVALMLNPIHANFGQPRVYLAEWRGTREFDGALKMGATEMRLVREIREHMPTTEQRVAWAILVARSVYQDPTFNDWADKWLSGEDRSASAARSAESAAWSAASAAESAAESAARSAVWIASAASIKVIMEDAAAWARVFA